MPWCLLLLVALRLLIKTASRCCWQGTRHSVTCCPSQKTCYSAPLNCALTARLLPQVRRQMREQEARERLQAVRQYSTSLPAPFPPAVTLPLHGQANGVPSNGKPQPQTTVGV